ncbi:aminoglycoside phosphotransferase family protein [Pseudidiomarina sp.]|uniref:aminoglycoside phosphotransferase family protein n=1 Tax=Pseudidiomarina sp. TaxID=2081707 RepID=UPI00299E6405|nr:phosphotransferase [Pseudidiomarina sp.]MDX1706598.1 phosphotransferase [Pseudidiomarina sp.]
MENQRELALQAWCEAVTGHAAGRLKTVSGDASFRRYFRTSDGNRTLIAVDAPPPQESLQPFMAIAAAYGNAGVAVPEVVAFDEAQGFMLLSDLGSTLLLSELSNASMTRWYKLALQDLPAIMQVTETAQGPLPAYDEALLRRELSLFHDWLLERHLGLRLNASQQLIWQSFCDTLVTNALEQPQVGVHRDYHARNIMVTGDQQLAYIDFQDAVKGAVTYDAVSLLRDCYVRWPQKRVSDLSAFLFNELQRQNVIDAGVSLTKWQRWFDLMGLQRHTKAAGIFARLYHRDGKSGYLQDVPRTLGYLHDVAAAYPEFDDYRLWLAKMVMPALADSR